MTAPSRSNLKLSCLYALLILGALSSLPPVYAQAQVAQEIWSLFNIISILAIAVGAVAIGSLIWMVVKFRERVPSKEGPLAPVAAHKKLRIVEALSITAATAILVYISYISTLSLYTIDLPPPGPEATTIQVVGHQWYWEFIYPDGSSSINKLDVKAGEVVKLEVTSEDVIHSLFIYDFAFKIDAVPGQINNFWLRVEEPGQYQIQCAEFCGLLHYAMTAEIIAT